MSQQSSSFLPDGDTPTGLPDVIRATADESALLLDHSIGEILRLMREDLVMDIVFISRYAGDQAIVAHASQSSEESSLKGLTHPREQSFCQRVLDGRLPAVMPDVIALQDTTRFLKHP